MICAVAVFFPATSRVCKLVKGTAAKRSGRARRDGRRAPAFLNPTCLSPEAAGGRL